MYRSNAWRVWPVRTKPRIRETEDLAAISRFLLREERLTGAFFCEMEVFTDIYNLEARSIARSGRNQAVHPLVPLQRLAGLACANQAADQIEIKALLIAINLG